MLRACVIPKERRVAAEVAAQQGAVAVSVSVSDRQVDVQVFAAGGAVREAQPVVQDGVQGDLGHEPGKEPEPLEPRHHRRELSVEDEYEEIGCSAERSHPEIRLIDSMQSVTHPT